MSWATKELGEVAELDRSSISASEIEPGTNYLGLEHIESGGKILDVPKVTNGELASSKFRFTADHLLYGKLRPYLAKIALPTFSGICSTDIIPVLPGPNLDRRYLCYFLRQGSMVEYANSRAAGANLPRLSPKELAKIEIPLPPLAEQKRIAGILDAADALRAKRREALAQLDTLLQATFLDLFGDPVANPKGWERKPIEDILHPDRPISYGILKPGDYEKDGIVMLRIQDIRGGRVSDDDLHRVPSSLSNQYKRTLLSGGEIVISLVGTIGLCALVPSRFAGSNVHRNLAVLAPSKSIDSAFLFQQMDSDHFQRQIRDTTKGGNQPLLNLGDLKRLLVLVPPINDQMRFRRFFESHERQKAAQCAHLAELDTLFAALQSRAFRGEL